MGVARRGRPLMLIGMVETKLLCGSHRIGYNVLVLSIYDVHNGRSRARIHRRRKQQKLNLLGAQYWKGSLPDGDSQDAP